MGGTYVCGINLMGKPRQGLGEDSKLCPRTWELKAVLRLGFELDLKTKTTVVLRWEGLQSRRQEALCSWH